MDTLKFALILLAGLIGGGATIFAYWIKEWRGIKAVERQDRRHWNE